MNEPASSRAGDRIATDADLAEVRSRFAESARDSARRAPLYARLAEGIADDDEVAGLLLAAPRTQRLPVLLFACVHWILLTEPDHELRRWYPNLTDRPADSDPYPVFAAFCRRHRSRLEHLVARRVTQTNEVGRCALLLPVLATTEREVERPLALVDVGSSAGLTLSLDRYEYRYDPGGRVGGPSPVSLSCAVRGSFLAPERPVTIAARVGLDRSPVDLDDPAAAAWLEACVWPDQLDRMRNLRAAIELTREVGPDLRTAEAVEDTSPAVREVAPAGHPVVINTWVLNYLEPTARAEYRTRLDAVGQDLDLTWVFAESPALVPELDVDHEPARAALTHLVVVAWRAGRRTQRTVAVTHPHGYWMHLR